MMKWEDTDTQRIRHICSFLKAGGGSLQAMHSYVNTRLAENGQAGIGLRTLQACIERLRRGNFSHSRQGLGEKARSRLFSVEYKAKVYRWAPETLFPEFGDLDEDERFTLPFLAGILRRFESIPAVQKILFRLPDIFGISEQEMESRMAIFQPGPVLYDPRHPGFDDSVVRCVINVLAHIHRGQAIAFNYTSVNVYDSKVEKLTLQQVKPLHIRYYEHYYYLAAADLAGEKVLNFRIDQIHRLNVEPIDDEQGEPLLFDPEALAKRLGIDAKFRDALGVWIHNNHERLYRIEISFRKWAASYVKRLQLHPSQKLVREDKARQTLVISLRLRLSEPASPNQKIIDRNPELAFLLGRFRGDCKILSAEVV